MHRGDLVDGVRHPDQFSFRAAASRLGITSSTLSHAMRQSGGTPQGALAAPHDAQRIAKTR
jgi:hypothetical protein